MHRNNWPCLAHNPSSKNIAYIELFALWWFLAHNAEALRDLMIPIFIDNSNNLAWLLKETAPLAYLSVLRPMQQLMLEYGIRLYPVLIPSAANELADLRSIARRT